MPNSVGTVGFRLLYNRIKRENGKKLFHFGNVSIQIRSFSTKIHTFLLKIDVTVFDIGTKNPRILFCIDWCIEHKKCLKLNFSSVV